MPADIYSNTENMGRGGWSWYTASSALYYTAVLNELLGITMENGKISLDYFRRIYYSVCGEKPEDLIKLKEQGFTVREIEILTSKSKSSVSRELKAGVVK